jgi:two-component system NarL family sensor kinase
LKKKKLIILLIIFFNLFQIRAYNFIKKQTLYNRVSFFVIQNNDTLILKELNEIKEFNRNKNFKETIDKSLNFITKYSSKLPIHVDNLYEVYIILGDIYRKNNNHSKSNLYYQKGLNLVEMKTLDLDYGFITYKSLKLCNLYLKIGNEFLRNGQKLKIGKEFTRNSQIDSAKYYYNKTLSIDALDEKSLSYQASASTNLSGLYMQDSLYDLAKDFAVRAITIHKKRNNKVSEAAAQNILASIFLEQNNYKEAKKSYKDALSLIKNEKGDRALRVREKLYYNLSFNLYKLKDYKAFNYQEQSYLIKDSLRDKEIRRIIEELGLKYDFDSQKEFLEQQQEVQLLKEKDKVRTTVVIGVLLLILLLFVIGYYNFRQKNLELKLTQSELLQNQNLDKLKSETQARVLDAVLNGRESERKEIAETLHDSVSALLSSANLHLQATKKQFDNGVPIEVIKTQKIITEASQKIRDLSHTLVSSVLLKFGLNFAIREIAEKYSNSELWLDTEIERLRRYDQKFEIKTYNIIQEFVNNILKHSKASNAVIKLKEKDGQILVQVSDDGIGFDKTKIGTKDGLGINQIEARIHMMRGKFSIISYKGEGTQIKVELPIQEKEVTNLL